MNSQNYKDDMSKKNNVEEEVSRVDSLKKKLYSTEFGKESSVRDRGFKHHDIDVGRNWEETDEKQAKIKALKEKEEMEEKMGLSRGNYLHNGSKLYGHYSPAEDATHKNQITTSFEKKTNNTFKDDGSHETIGSFLSDKFANKRAAETQKKLDSENVTLRYAAAIMQKGGQPKEIYPNVNGEQSNLSVEKNNDSVLENYHPEFSVTTVGDNRLDRINIATRTASMRNNIDEDVNLETEKKKRFSFSVFLFTIIFVFFLTAIGYAYFTLQKGTNIVSPNKVDIAVSGPISVRSGQINEFSIDITNRNTTDLTLADLVIQYPYGTMSPDDSSIALNNERINVGTIKPGETIRRKASAVFFGEENVKKNINYAVEFSIPDSSNIFHTTKDIGVIIAGSPVTAKITNVKEVTNNQDLSFDIEIQSNTEEVVKNIQLHVEYPFGYKLTHSNVEPIFGNNTWNIGEIAALDTKTIHLDGKLVGTSNLEKNFRFTLGVADPKTSEMITVLSTQDQKVVIQKPFVSAKLSLDGAVQDFKPVKYEDSIQADIVFTNNIDIPITDAVIEISMDGILIDRSSIKSNNGFYKSSNDTIFWDKSQESRLSLIDPGESREVSFNFKILKLKNSLVQTLRRSATTMSVTIKGKRLNEESVPEEIKSIIVQELRLETDPSFESSISQKTGPFANTGYFPPKVNSETTYTYNAHITNTANSLKDVVFTAKLPPNVTWKNVYSKDIPASSVSYSSGKREITIRLGNISAGAGIDAPAKDFSFQLGFTPTLTQVGTAPVLIYSPRISGVDSFTLRRIDRGIDGLDIIPAGDSGNLGDGIVIE